MTLQQWLESIGCYDVRPVKVTIGQQTYEGCEYRQRMRAPEGSQKAGQEYEIHALYLLASKMPSCLQRNGVCLTREGDARDWYVAGYSGRLCWQKGKFWQAHRERCLADVERQKEHEPFGPAFYLHPWDCGGRIDQHEERPYRRIPMKVRLVGEEPCAFIGCEREAEGLNEGRWAFCEEHLALQCEG